MAGEVESASLSSPAKARPIDVYVGRRIRLARERQGKSASELAAEIGVSLSLVEACEAGRQKASSMLVFDVSNVLSVSLGFLYGFTK